VAELNEIKALQKNVSKDQASKDGLLGCRRRTAVERIDAGTGGKV
jgi:hypothetical protein